MIWPAAAGPIPAGMSDDMKMWAMTAAVERLGGSFSAEDGVEPRNMPAYRRLTPTSVRRLTGQVQALPASTPIGRVTMGRAAVAEVRISKAGLVPFT